MNHPNRRNYRLRRRMKTYLFSVPFRLPVPPFWITWNSAIQRSFRSCPQTASFLLRLPSPSVRGKAFLTSSGGFAASTASTWNPHGRRFTTAPISRGLPISMNSTWAAAPAGCTRSTAGFQTMAVQAICFRTAITSAGSIPAITEKTSEAR